MKTLSQNNTVDVPRSTYQKLLRTPQWGRKRSLVLSRDNNRCQNCSDSKKLQVHHRQYQYNNITNALIMPWEYDDKYLITLCESCHKMGHKLYKVPVINLNNKLK